MEKSQYLIVTQGQLTFDAEGTEGGPFHSRIAHVPSRHSGITIGRGYDLKYRQQDAVIKDLEKAGINKGIAKIYGAGVGLSGSAAKKFIVEHPLKEITLAAQHKLFQMTYQEIEQDVIRICNKTSVVKAYGDIHWETLPALLKDLTIDLRYRGDYTPYSRYLLQRALVNRAWLSLRRIFSERDYWRKVPEDRFLRRRNFLNGIQ